MASASTLARYASTRTHAIAVLLTIIAVACTSPMDLDVGRSKTYTDGSVHPKRLSFLYYFGDSAYEAIVSDTSLLNTIWIERGVRPYELTIPWFVFDFPDTIELTSEYSPFVTQLCFSAYRIPCDNKYRNYVNNYTWLNGNYLDPLGNAVPFKWYADNAGRQLRIAWTGIYSQRLIKGSLQVLLADPIAPRYVTYRGHLTLEY